ncbi:hypothetical protein, partial [Rhodopseudomonas sp. BR0C11]|uniref:hypothetical protein n=1 Tax=Rhodopseudomonas sp. BR0C11 TaxID=2269370 RepID=UPI001967A149
AILVKLARPSFIPILFSLMSRTFALGAVRLLLGRAEIVSAPRAHRRQHYASPRETTVNIGVLELPRAANSYL